MWRWEDLAVRPSGVGARRDVVDQPTATFARFESHVTTLNPGMASHAPHRHAIEEFIIVREGQVEVNLNGTPHRVGPGSLCFFASNELHNIRNVGDSPATYLVFNFGTPATAAIASSGEAMAAASSSNALGSTAFDWEKLTVVTTNTGARRGIVDRPTRTWTNFESHVTTLHPGMAPHAAHRHPDEELVIIKEGTLEITINGVSYQAGPGSIAFFGSNDEHGLRNIGSTPATYFIVRVITAETPKS